MKNKEKELTFIKSMFDDFFDEVVKYYFCDEDTEFIIDYDNMYKMLKNFFERNVINKYKHWFWEALCSIWLKMATRSYKLYCQSERPNLETLKLVFDQLHNLIIMSYRIDVLTTIEEDDLIWQKIALEIPQITAIDIYATSMIGEVVKFMEVRFKYIEQERQNYRGKIV